MPRWPHLLFIKFVYFYIYFEYIYNEFVIYQFVNKCISNSWTLKKVLVHPVPSLDNIHISWGRPLHSLYLVICVTLLRNIFSWEKLKWEEWVFIIHIRLFSHHLEINLLIYYPFLNKMTFIISSLSPKKKKIFWNFTMFFSSLTLSSLNELI